MRQIPTLLAFLCLSTCLNGQSFSIELNEQHQGYALLDSVLRDKKMVLLGELDHGDGSSFKAKTALIKYLHEHLGYNTLVFESSLINADLLWSTIGDSAAFRNSVPDNIYHIWSEVAETQELFQYLEAQYRNGTPLRLLGIDPQFSGKQYSKSFVDMLQQSLPPAVVNTPAFADFVHDIRLMSTWMQFPKKNELRLTASAFHDYCDTLLAAIRQNPALQAKWPIWGLYLENLKTMGSIKRGRDKTSFEKRDKRMFDNTEHWLREFPDEKFIIWAANAHIIRRDGQLTPSGKPYYLLGLKKLGDHLHEHHAKDLYAIAVAAGKGATLDFSNPTKTNTIRKAPEHSLEGLLSGKKACLVDLALFEKVQQLDQYEAQVFYTNIRCKARWSRHFDGVIYIPEMKPATPLGESNK